MAGPSRFLLVAVGSAAALWLVAAAIGVSADVLQRDAIVLGFAGVAAASLVEMVLKRRRPSEPAASAKTSHEES
jgi:hypothetical protein